MPWRDAEEQAVLDIVKGASGKGQLAFGAMVSDTIAHPNPPVTRAVKMTADALAKAGHKIIEWKPPAQQELVDITLKTWVYDGGKDLHDSFALSGEPMSPQVKMSYGDKPGEMMTAAQIAENNVAKRSIQKLYMDYHNSTASETGTGRPIDGIICPLAPYPAARPESYKYYGFSVWVNGLDWATVVVPVLLADKNIDKYPEGFTPTNDTDKTIFEDYDPEIYHESHTSVQIVGRRYEEEKMLAIAEYVGGILEQQK